MNCPECGYTFYCPCVHCMERHKPEIPWKSFGDDTQACGKCGLRMHLDAWLDEEVRQVKKAGLWPARE